MKFLASLCALFLLISCASNPPQQLTRYEFERPQMGVPFKILLYAPNKEIATAASEAAFKRVAELNASMSDYEYDSELSQLGRTSAQGQAVKVSPELWTVLSTAQQFSKASNGAFDVTVGPMVQLWRKARREQKLPPAEAIEKAQKRIGYTNVILRNQTVELKAPDMRLDFGAIGKGYAADEALRILRQHGIKRALAAASGDGAAGDPPPGEKGWKIQLVNTADTDARGTAFLLLKNCGVATSGDLFQFVEIDGKRYSHIVDPKTGVGLTDRSMATIVAKDAITADALSTTVSVMGPADGLKLARRFGASGRAARITPEGARIEVATHDFRNRVIWVK